MLHQQNLFIWMIPPVIDSDGFRPNVGIILTNDQGQLLWARRVGGHDAWQFPQGGINPNETPEQALYRELHEEVGLRREDVEILACTRGWLRYRLPHRLVRHNSVPLCVGQKQKWFLLRLRSDDSALKRAMPSSQVETSERPSNFGAWRHNSRNTSLATSSAIASDPVWRATKR